MASTIEGNKTVNKLLHILDIFLTAGASLSLRQLSEASGLPRASLYRILNPMLEQGFLHLNPASKLYGPGNKLYHLGLLAHHTQDFNSMLPEWLKQLHEEARHTVLVAQMTGGHVVYLQKEEKLEGLKISPLLGVPHPPGHGVLGRLLLAYMPEDAAKGLIENNPPKSWLQNAWPGWQAALPCLHELRAKGYAAGRGENDPTTSVLGFPIYGKDGQVKAALGMLVPSMLLDAAEAARCLDLLRQYALRISQALGYLPAA